MKLRVKSVLPELKRQARDRVDEHFNELAVANAHKDGVALRKKVKPDPLLQREDARTKLLGQIDAAQAPADITEVLNTLP